MNKTEPDAYTVEAGRLILKNGVRFITILRRAATDPVDADEVTHKIAGFLNAEAMSDYLATHPWTNTKEGSTSDPIIWEG